MVVFDRQGVRDAVETGTIAENVESPSGRRVMVAAERETDDERRAGPDRELQEPP